jgi:excisionase family DNA binding protein
MSSPYMTITEVAEYARVSPKTVRRWISKHGLPRVKTVDTQRARVLVKRADLEKFLDRDYNGRTA